MKNPFRLFLQSRLTLWLMAALVIVVVLVILFLRSAKPLPENKNSPAANTTPPLEILASDAQVIAPVNFQVVLPISGTISAPTQSVVKSYVSGEIKAIHAREGQSVARNDVVIQIDDRETQARVEQAKGALRAAQGQLAISRQSLSNNQSLMEQGFISKATFDTSQSQFDIAKANAESAQAALDVAQKSLADTVLRAPISGVISRRLVQVGEKVSPDTRLLELVSLSGLELQAAVPSTDVGQVRLGQKISFTIAGVDVPQDAKVVRINPATETGSRSLLIYANLSGDTASRVRVGMFGQGGIILREARAIALPESALQKRGDKNFVYVIEGDLLTEREVTLGVRGDANRANVVEIINGLKSRERVIVNNLGVLPVGVRVRVVQ